MVKHRPKHREGGGKHEGGQWVSPGCLNYRHGCCTGEDETRMRSRNLIVHKGSSLVNKSQNIAHSLLPAIMRIYLTNNSSFFMELNYASQNSHVEVRQNMK